MINQRVTKLLIISTVLIFGSCTVYQTPVTINYVDVSTHSVNARSTISDIEHHKKELAIKNKTKINESTKEDSSTTINTVTTLKVGCEKFKLPNMQAEPIIIAQQMTTIKKNDGKALSEFLTEHIKRVHQVNVDNAKMLKEAIDKHVKTCTGY